MKFLLSIVLLFASLACASARDESLSSVNRLAITRAVNATCDEMLAAAESLNVDELFRHVADTDQGAVAVNGVLFLTRQNALEQTRANFVGIRSIRYDASARRVTVLSPTSALMVMTLTTYVGMDDGRTFSRPSIQSIVFVLRDNTWKVVHSHQSNPPAN